MRRSAGIDPCPAGIPPNSAGVRTCGGAPGAGLIVLNPEDGQSVTKAPDLGLFRHPPDRLVRQRSVIYAEKYLGRLLGKIPD
ncbi:MAG: hypothetical protein WDO73_28565 [Ignavibacteriota bacterium]